MFARVATGSGQLSRWMPGKNSICELNIATHHPEITDLRVGQWYREWYSGPDPSRRLLPPAETQLPGFTRAKLRVFRWGAPPSVWQCWFSAGIGCCDGFHPFVRTIWLRRKCLFFFFGINPRSCTSTFWLHTTRQESRTAGYQNTSLPCVGGRDATWCVRFPSQQNTLKFACCGY